MTAPDEKRQVLRARANALAREPETPGAPGEALTVLKFGLADEWYGIEATYIREVRPFADLTPLPCTPPFVLGLVNVRGRIRPVLDLRKFFELPEQGIYDLHTAVLVHAHDMEVGILADRVVGMCDVPLADLQASLPTLTGVREQYMKGVTPEHMVVLDIDAILADERIIVNENVDE